MANIPRVLNIDIPLNQSAFLWGPRKTGKTTFLKTKYPKSLTYDFLQTDLDKQKRRPPGYGQEEKRGPFFKLQSNISVEG